MRMSEQINEIATSISKAQAEMKPAPKDNKNPFFKSNYSDITSVWESIRKPITSNGLSVWQDVMTTDKSISIVTMVVHSSGQWIEFGPFTVPLAKSDIQSIGSATSYARRYALCAALGVVSGDQDDDGENAIDRNTQQAPKNGNAAPVPPKVLVSVERSNYIKKAFNEAPDAVREKINSFMDKFGLTFETLNEKQAANIEQGLQL